MVATAVDRRNNHKWLSDNNFLGGFEIAEGSGEG